MNSTYCLAIVIGALLIVWPDETLSVIASYSLKIQIYFLNLKTKWAAWRAYRGIVSFCKREGFPAPGPFVYVDLWDRSR